ncbi:MAG: ferritin family protein [Candidatus Aminicenantia bacterium]
MELSSYTLQDLLLTALKSEIEARDFYKKIAEGVKNFLLKDRILFLASEEEKHRRVFEKIYIEKFPGKELVLPEKSPVPLPELKIEDERVPINDVFWMAMQAEKSAHDFYSSFAERFPFDSVERKMLLYVASMEMGHYQLLNTERENAMKFEDFDIIFPLTHIGP